VSATEIESSSISRFGPPSKLRRGFSRIALLASLLALVVSACSAAAAVPGKKSVVVTYSILGAVVRDLVGDAANVTVLMPNGADPHEWAPSARGIATLTHADLLVENGLNLESGLGSAFSLAAEAGVHVFVAADHIRVRHVGQGEGVDNSADQRAGAADPHLWLDPLAMRDIVAALADQLESHLGLDLSDRPTELEGRLTALNGQIQSIMSAVPAQDRVLVTGHESFGYFADRYGLKLVGAIVPSLSAGAESAAANLPKVEATVKAQHVKAIFAEMGTSSAVADAVAADTGARLVQVRTESLPSDGSYFTFLTDVARVVADNLT
jgi:zinc/manganese transport system substrate-binding protein